MSEIPAERTEVEIVFGRGEHHTAHETRIPEGFARKVENWDLDDNLLAITRPDLVVTGGLDVHSLWQAPESKTVYCVAEDLLCMAEGDTLEPVLDASGDPIPAGTRDRMFYVEHLGTVWYTNGRINGRVAAGVAEEWGVWNPMPGNRSSTENVRFLTYVDAHGRESGAVRFDVGTPAYIPGKASRLYWATEESTIYRLNGDGRTLETEHLLVMPPGRFLGFFAGRAIVARGNRLYYSLPLNYGLCDPRYNFHTFPERICGVGTMSRGIYVGTRSTIYYLSGTDPSDWTERPVAREGMIFGSGCKVPGDILTQDAIPADHHQDIYAYLTRSGVGFALDGGNIIEPTGDRVRLPVDTEVRMDVVAREGYYQLVAVPQQPVSPASSKAIDSPIETGAL